MSTATALTTIPTETALQVFSTEQGLEPYLAKIRAEIDAFVPDVSTKKGRDEIASIAHSVARSKTYLDGVGKELVAELKELPKKIDASRKTMRDTLDAWKDEVRQPLTNWEAAEQTRIDGHKRSIERLLHLTSDLHSLDAAELQSCIATAEAVELGEHWQEFTTEAAVAKDRTLTALREQLGQRQRYEAEQAELARLRDEKAARDRQDEQDRIAREAAERATREAEQRAQAERDAAAKREAEAKAAAERRELELQLQAEQAQRQAAEAEQRAQRAAEAERQRIEREAQAEREATARREADKAHKARVNREALQAFMQGGLDQATAKAAVTLIAQSRIPHISISY